MLCFPQQPVDLIGRLSNPPDTLESLADQGSCASPPPAQSASKGPKSSFSSARAGDSDQKGQPSNPVQRRLSRGDSDQLARLYEEGASIDALGRRYRVHRTTVIRHLDDLGVRRRRVVRKMTNPHVAQASKRYAEGLSLADVASEFGVHERTLAREFRGAGTPIRGRRGWSR